MTLVNDSSSRVRVNPISIRMRHFWTQRIRPVFIRPSPLHTFYFYRKMDQSPKNRKQTCIQFLAALFPSVATAQSLSCALSLMLLLCLQHHCFDARVSFISFRLFPAVSLPLALCLLSELIFCFFLVKH